MSMAKEEAETQTTELQRDGGLIALEMGLKGANVSSDQKITVDHIPPRKRPVITRNLLMQTGISKEMRNVYCAARRGEIPMHEATALIYMLHRLSAVVEIAKAEKPSSWDEIFNSIR